MSATVLRLPRSSAAPGLRSRQCLLFLVLLGGLALPAFPQPIELLTVPAPSVTPAAGGGGDSVAPVLSADGRYVLFSSTANNLALSASNTAIRGTAQPRLNVYLRDPARTTLISVSQWGTNGGNGDSIATDVSKYGQYAIFESSASDLVAGDTNNCTDVFWRDIGLGLTRLVSARTNGGAANGDSTESTMTFDGRYVAFVSAATNLVSGDTNAIPDVFVMDMQSNRMMLVSVGAMATNSATTNAGSSSPDLSSDGRYVAFYSAATNLVPGVPGGGEIYVRDMEDGITYWASADARGILATMAWMGNPTNALISRPLISRDGRYVVYYASPASGSYVAAGIILRYSIETGLTELVYTNANVIASCASDEMRCFDMTPDGEFIAFLANASASSSDIGKYSCVRVWSGLTRDTVLASGNLSGVLPSQSVVGWPAIDPTGRFVAFMSPITNQSTFVTNRLNPGYHIYVRDLQAGATKAVDTDTNGVLSGVSSYVLSRLVAGGQYLAFQAPDGNLVAGDSNRADDIFLRDLVTGTTALVSAREATLPSYTPNAFTAGYPLASSADGRYLAFTSDAENLVPNDTNKCMDVFVRDLVAGATYLVSCRTNGMSPWDGSSLEPSISADGRYIAFTSYATNLVPNINKTTLMRDVFVRDMVAGTSVLASVNLTHTGPGSGHSFAPSISGDGQSVMFRSVANNLAAGVTSSQYENLYYRSLASGVTRALTTNGVAASAMTPDGHWVAYITPTNSGTPYLYVWDAQADARVFTNAITVPAMLSISRDGNRIACATTSQLVVTDRRSNTMWPTWTIGLISPSSRIGLAFSADGRFLTYASRTAQLLTDTNNNYDVYLYDLQTNTKLLVSQVAGMAANDASDCPDISADGRFVAYRSVATNLVAGDNNAAGDVFLYDRTTSKTSLLSMRRGGGGVADSWSFRPHFTSNGHQVLFLSAASDLVGFDFNHASDLFSYTMFYSQITPGASLGQGPTLAWPAVPGKTYHVQFRADLRNTSSWQEAGGSVTIVDDVAYFTDPSPPASQRYYRIVSN